MKQTGLLVACIIFLTVIAIISAGCVQAPVSPPAAAVAADNAPSPEVSADLQRILDDGVRTSGVPGVQAGISTPDWTWNGAAGNASPVTGERAAPGMQFFIASVSKVFTSIAIQQLAAEGKLSLNDPIDRWLPEDLAERIPNGHTITVRHLLDHTSGIADYDEDAIIAMELQNPSVPVPFATGIAMGLNASPLYPPGTNYTYSNVNYNLLALIADKAAGMPYEEYVNRTILVPAGMNDTYLSRINYFSGPHMQATEQLADGKTYDFTGLYVQFDRGAGEVVSTTADLNRFHRAVRGGQLISRSSLADMENVTSVSVRVKGSASSGYGLGYEVQRIPEMNLTLSGHSGGYYGSSTFFYYSPEQDAYVTLNANSAVRAADAYNGIYLPIFRYLQQWQASGTGNASPAFSMTVPVAPVPVPSGSGTQIAYELALAPADGVMPDIGKVEALDAATGTVLFSADGDLLAGLYHPASVPPPTAGELQNGTGKNPSPRVSVWFAVPPDAVPDRLVHRLTLNRSAAGLPPVTVTGGEVAIRKDAAPVVIGAPMSGPGWLAMETTSPFTHHFLAQITMNGVTRVPQRYAQDWILLDPETGAAAKGNASLARNYFGFGKEIHAGAEGTVVAALDGLPDIETIYSAPPATLETAAGNFVIIDIGNKKYACYAHMVNGSIRVMPGDAVKEGQVIGLMGNSGNSDLPHLHFQVVTDTPSFLGAEGYPHVYRSFDSLGWVNQSRAAERQADPGYTLDRLWSDMGDYAEFLKIPVHRQNMLPDNNEIVRFP
jgi:D-alanyl-D-alanine carboxypeptidase